MDIPRLAKSRLDELICAYRCKNNFSNGQRVYRSFLEGHVMQSMDIANQYQIIKQIGFVSHHHVTYYSDDKVDLFCDPGSDFFFFL